MVDVQQRVVRLQTLSAHPIIKLNHPPNCKSCMFDINRLYICLMMMLLHIYSRPTNTPTKSPKTNNPTIQPTYEPSKCNLHNQCHSAIYPHTLICLYALAELPTEIPSHSPTYTPTDCSDVGETCDVTSNCCSDFAGCNRVSPSTRRCCGVTGYHCRENADCCSGLDCLGRRTTGFGTKVCGVLPTHR